MSKLKEWLSKTLEKLSMRKARLKVAQRRYLLFHKKAYKAHLKKIKYQRKANKMRAEEHPLAERKATRIATRAHAVELKSSAKAQYWLGQIKIHQQAINDLNVNKAEAEAAIEKYKKEHGVTVDRNRVTGGGPVERLRVAIHTAAHNCSTGVQNNYYSMTGAMPDTGHILRGYPDGHRWDCSTFADGIYICCGLESPSGGKSVGWTGTEGEHGKKIAEDDARTGDLVLYGSFPHHHVEVVDNPEAKTTIGHGSAPIDRGVFNLFGDYDYTIRRYVK